VLEASEHYKTIVIHIFYIFSNFGAERKKYRTPIFGDNPRSQSIFFVTSQTYF